jgi:hypothetical protein
MPTELFEHEAPKLIAGNAPDASTNETGGFDPRKTGRILLWTAIVTFCGAALASIIVILSGGFGDTEAKILLSSFSIAAYSLAGLIATARFGRRPLFLAPAGLGSAALGLVLTLALIWTEAGNDALWRIALSVMVIAGAIAHANLLLGNQERKDPAALVLKATFAVSALLTALIVVPILAAGEPGGGYWKLVAVLAVLLVLGTLVVPIVRKMSDTGNVPVALTPPAAPAAAGQLEIRYQGRQFRITADTDGGSAPNIRVWAIDGPEARPILFDQDAAAADTHAALAHAVQQITRAVDTGTL